jgi:hypothetical protein
MPPAAGSCTACMSPMHVHHVLMTPLCPGPRPCSVLQESLLQLATVCICVCVSLFSLVGCLRNHTPQATNLRTPPPTPCRSVHHVCLTAYLHVHIVSRSHSICTAAADKRMAAQSMLLLIRVQTDTPPVRTPCPHVNHISVSRPHASCLRRSPAVLCLALNPFSPRPRVVSNHAQPLCPAPRPSTTLTHHVCSPKCTALSMTIMHTPSELFSPCLQENIESVHCCIPQPAWTT